MRIYGWALLGAMMFAPATDAAELSMQDGSVVIGKILRLTDGSDLVVDTEHMDEITLEWDAVVRIRDTPAVEIEFYDGRSVVGAITLDDRGLTIIGTSTVNVDPADVYSISEMKLTFWDRLDAYTDLGANIVRGNSRVTQMSLGAGLGYDALAYELSIDATTFLNEQPEGDDARRTTLAANYTRDLGRGWGAIGTYQYESDEQQGLDGRSLLGGAVGRRVLNTRTNRLELFIGLALNSEDFESTSAEESLEGQLGTRYRLRADADIDMTMIIFPNLEQSDRYRVQFDASLIVDLINDFDLKVTLYDRYDSKSPGASETNDYGLTLGLRWSY